MKSRWSSSDADALVADYGARGIAADLALRVYGARLLGGDPRLVLHGGGNSSVKTQGYELTGEPVDVVCVKGSGWDMATIAPEGFPAVRLAPLQQLRALDALDDGDMVNAHRGNLLDSTAPNPSVETLLHAFLPHKFIDHTHANAVLALTDQPDGAAICAEVFGDRAALVPYIMPGFALAKAAAAIQAEHPECIGLILLKHGVFSFADSARESYDRMIALVSLAEARLARGRRTVFAAAKLPAKRAAPAALAPLLRGLTRIENSDRHGAAGRFVLAFRSGGAIDDFVGGAELARYAGAGVVTPDHAIRTKPWPLVLPSPEAGRLDDFAAAAARAIAAYKADYEAYFTRNNAAQVVPKKPLDPVPRVILVPGVGLFALGRSAAAAGVVADLAEAAIAVISAAEAIDRFESIGEADLFDIEYWSLEQAKLGRGATPPLAGHVALVTGGAGTIGAAIAAAFAAEGAAVAVLDRDGARAEAVAGEIGGLGLACDVTERDAMAAVFDRICEAYGGVDIVVSNAGAAWQGRIGAVSDAVLRESFELNFFAHQTVARQAVRIMRAQGMGGVLLFNASKQAINPGADFGPYGLPKAATLFLMRQYALDYGRDGIRANAVNADRIRSGLLTGEMIQQRALARDVSAEDYMTGNLLRREVSAYDVAQAFVALAKARKTTGAVLAVDGGNIAAAPR